MGGTSFNNFTGLICTYIIDFFSYNIVFSVPLLSHHPCIRTSKKKNIYAVKLHHNLSITMEHRYLLIMVNNFLEICIQCFQHRILEGPDKIY